MFPIFPIKRNWILMIRMDLHRNNEGSHRNWLLLQLVPSSSSSSFDHPPLCECINIYMCAVCTSHVRFSGAIYFILYSTLAPVNGLFRMLDPIPIFIPTNKAHQVRSHIPQCEMPTATAIVPPISIGSYFTCLHLRAVDTSNHTYTHQVECRFCTFSLPVWMRCAYVCVCILFWVLKLTPPHRKIDGISEQQWQAAIFFQ